MTTTSTRQSGADLLRGAAHLLRTPLGVIVGMSTTLRDYDERFSPEQRRR
jgi:K+-sensing histidine kinase KdpD